MQISTRKEDFLIDTIKLRDDLDELNSVFTNPRIVKVFHGANSDYQWLQKDLGLYLVNVFDTFFASKALNNQQHSLAYQLHLYCGINADKQE